MKKYFVLFLLIAVIALPVVGCSLKDEAQNSNFQNEPNKPVVSETVENNDNSTVAQNEEEIQINSPDSFSFELVTNSNGNLSSIKYWKQNESYRIEMPDSMTNEKFIIINSEKDKALYQYLPDQKMAIKLTQENSIIDMDMGLFSISELTFDKEDLKELKENGNLEETTYNGQDVYYSEIKALGLNSVSRIWISKEYGLLIRMEQELDGKIVMSQEIKNFSKGPFDESLFTIPEGIDIQE